MLTKLNHRFASWQVRRMFSAEKNVNVRCGKRRGSFLPSTVIFEDGGEKEVTLNAISTADMVFVGLLISFLVAPFIAYALQ